MIDNMFCYRNFSAFAQNEKTVREYIVGHVTLKFKPGIFAHYYVSDFY